MLSKSKIYKPALRCNKCDRIIYPNKEHTCLRKGFFRNSTWQKNKILVTEHFEKLNNKKKKD